MSRSPRASDKKTRNVEEFRDDGGRKKNFAGSRPLPHSVVQLNSWVELPQSTPESACTSGTPHPEARSPSRPRSALGLGSHARALLVAARGGRPRRTGLAPALARGLERLEAVGAGDAGQGRHDEAAARGRSGRGPRRGPRRGGAARAAGAHRGRRGRRSSTPRAGRRSRGQTANAAVRPAVASCSCCGLRRHHRGHGGIVAELVGAQRVGPSAPRLRRGGHQRPDGLLRPRLQTLGQVVASLSSRASPGLRVTLAGVTEAVPARRARSRRHLGRAGVEVARAADQERVLALHLAL